MATSWKDFAAKHKLNLLLYSSKKSIFIHPFEKQWYYAMTMSVPPSICLSITPLSICSHYHIIMKFSGVITIDRRDVHTKGQGQRSKVKVLEVKTQQSCFTIIIEQWTASCKAIFLEYRCYIKHGGIITNLYLWNPWGMLLICWNAAVGVCGPWIRICNILC